jgi:hypothetical protein
VFESQLKFRCDYPITDVGVLVVLQGCPLLRETDVENAARIGTGLRAGLAQQCNFSRIDWSKWAGLSDALAQGVLMVSPNLVAMECKECRHLTDATLAVCAQHCLRLETIILVCFGVTNLGIRTMVNGAANTLREIRIAGCNQLGDDAVFAIAKLCVRLDCFTLRECPLVTGNALRALVTKRGHLLETLLIYDGPALDDATVLTIAEHCPRLRCFNCFIPASDAAVAVLRKRCVHLQWDPAAERLTFRGKVTSVVLLFLWLTAVLFFSTARPRRRRLDAVQVPAYVRTAFMTDFHDFVTHIAQKLPSVEPQTVVEIRQRVKTPGVVNATSAGDNDKMEYGGPPPPPQYSSRYLYSDMVLAATISTVLGYWTAPLTEWTSRDIARGSNAFRKRCLRMSYDELCAILEMREFADSGVIVCKRLERAMSLTAAWEVLSTHDFYVHPARSILARWAIEIVELMTRYVALLCGAGCGIHDT